MGTAGPARLPTRSSEDRGMARYLVYVVVVAAIVLAGWGRLSRMRTLALATAILALIVAGSYLTVEPRMGVVPWYHVVGVAGCYGAPVIALVLAEQLSRS